MVVGGDSSSSMVSPAPSVCVWFRRSGKTFSRRSLLKRIYQSRMATGRVAVAAGYLARRPRVQNRGSQDQLMRGETSRMERSNEG